MTDFRALCAELADSLEEWLSFNSINGIPLDDGTDAELIYRARTALVQPEPQGLTDEEDEERFQRWWFNEGSGMRPLNGEDQEEHARRVSRIAWHNGAYVARWGRPTVEPVPNVPSDDEIERKAIANADTDDEYRAFKNGAFFVQEHMNRPAIAPIPAFERLPGPEDCDAEGRCWWESPESKHIIYDMNPVDKEEITTPPAYYLRERHPLWTLNRRWLPHWALPVPQQEAGQ